MCFNSHRCVKMDCHEPDTHYTLLGVFKEPNYINWMDQLLQYQGDCVWTDDELWLMQYAGMYGMPDTPGCTRIQNDYYNDAENGDISLYYDLKPDDYGRRSIGLYTDERCIVPFHRQEAEMTNVSLTSILQEEGFRTFRYDTFENELLAWNDAFDVFKTCQPCQTYDLTSFVAGRNYVANSDGNRYMNAKDGDNAFNCRQASSNGNDNYQSVNQVSQTYQEYI